MKLHFGKLTICIVMLSVLLFPAAVQGMPDTNHAESSITNASTISPVDTALSYSSADPQQLEVGAIEAAFVDSTMTSANHNNENHLRVGPYDEFGGVAWTFIEFGPVKASRGGPLPEGSTITGVALKLYKEDTQSGPVEIYQPMTDFSESSLTWDNKPNTYNAIRGSGTLPSSTGWCTINMSNATIVTDPENHGRNPSMAITK